MIRLLFVFLVLLSLVIPASASAQVTDDCSTMAATVSGLRECVQHAFAMGHITSAGVEQSLLAELDAAQAALNRGQPRVAIQLLQAFVHEVTAQSGKAIVAEHAAHLVEHAQMVIQSLQH